MTKPSPDRSAIPIGIGVLAMAALLVAWLVFLGTAPFVLGCLVMLALLGGEVALLVRPNER
jgi:hypothetical protein